MNILPAHRQIYQFYKDQGFKNLGKAIRRTGVYSEDVAKRVNIITKSQSWQKLMDEQMPEEMVAQRHAEVINKRSYRTVKDASGNEVEVDNGPDPIAVKGIEMAYKLRGAFKEKEKEAPSTVMYNLFYKPEVREHMKVFENNLKDTLMHLLE